MRGEGQARVLKKRLMLLLRDELETPLNELFFSADGLITTIAGAVE